MLKTLQYRLFMAIFMLCAVACSCAAADKFVLVIDAGHGGKDPGAKGKHSMEKDINLPVALAFGKYVERNCSDVKVIYTRKTDVFVELKERANIANRNKADLFISIHTNALDGGKIARGFQTYTMGMNNAAENLNVAKRENSVILIEKNYKQTYAGFDPNSSESYIMFELLQDNNMANSVDLAKTVQAEVCAHSGRANKGVHQAGLLVLRETSMPGCLIELGFITTPDEEDFLNTSDGQDKMAKGIYNAFVKYKKKHGKRKIAENEMDDEDKQNRLMAETVNEISDSDEQLGQNDHDVPLANWMKDEIEDAPEQIDSLSMVFEDDSRLQSEIQFVKQRAVRVQPSPALVSPPSPLAPIKAEDASSSSNKEQEDPPEAYTTLTKEPDTEQTTSHTSQRPEPSPQLDLRSSSESPSSLPDPSQLQTPLPVVVNATPERATHVIAAQDSIPHQIETKSETAQVHAQDSIPHQIDTKSETAQVHAQDSIPHQIDTKRETAQVHAQNSVPHQIDTKSETAQAHAQDSVPHQIDTKRETAQVHAQDERKDTVMSSNSQRRNIAQVSPAKQVVTTTKPHMKPAANSKRPTAEVKEPGKTMFKVQISANAENHAVDSAFFKGLKNIDSFHENGMVKYTVGCTSNFAEIQELRTSLLGDFPGAFIIAFKDDKKISLQDAIAEYKKQNKR